MPTDASDPSHLRDLFLAWEVRGEPPPSIDDGTWRDLDLDLLVQRIAGAASELGRLTLYRWLRSPATEAMELPRIEARRALIASPADDGTAGERLSRLPRIPILLLDALAGRARLPSLGWAPRALTACALLAPGLLFLSTQAGVLAIAAVFVANLAYRMWAQRTVESAMASLTFLLEALKAGTQLSGSHPGGARLLVLLRELRPLSKALQSLELPAVLDQFPGEYVRLFLLNDERRLSRSVTLVERHREALTELMQRLGDLEAAIAVRAFQDARLGCAPEVSGREAPLVAEALRHPLIEDGAIGNALSLSGGMVITGSNMSGKSTFLRAVALNALLAQSIGWACAGTWRAPLLKIATSLRHDDRLASGESYYFAEALRLRALIALARGPGALIIIDEPFRGTNSVERIAAGVAVLRHLGNQRAKVLVATHDRELGELLRPDWEEGHFTDHCSEEGLRFDYRLRPGRATSGNAIHLLTVLGYPVAVTDEAKRLAGSLPHRA